MKKLVMISLVFCMVFVLAACGNKTTNTDGDTTTPAPATETGTPAPTEAAKTAAPAEELSGKILFATNRTDIVDTLMKDYAKKFQEKYPKVEISFEAYTDYAKDIKVKMASNEYPDLLLNPGLLKTDFPKYYAELDDMGLNDKIRFRDLMTYNGKLYGINGGAIAYLVVYNKKAFTKAGIADVPKTWDEFLADCAKLKAAGIRPINTNFKDSWPLQAWDFAAGIIEGDPSYHENWLKSDTPWTVDGPVAKSVGLVKTLVDKGYTEKDLLSTNWDQSHKDLATGAVAMVNLGNYMANVAVQHGGVIEDFGYFAMPLDNSGTNSVTLSPDWSYAINKNSKSLPATKAFLKFMIEESGYTDFAGLLSVIKDQKPKDPALAAFMDSGAKFVEPTPGSDDFTAVMNKAQIDLYKMYQEFILAKDLKSVMDKYNKKWADAKKALGK